MKIIITMSLLLFLSLSCSHHHKKGAHHHHDCAEKCGVKEKSTGAEDTFKHKCASSVLEGDIHVDGKEEYNLKHGGRIYYFSTQEKKDSFTKNLEQNILKADKVWKEHDHDHNTKF